MRRVLNGNGSHKLQPQVGRARFLYDWSMHADLRPPQLAGVTLINSEMPQAIRGHRISGVAPHLASPRQRAHPPPPKGLPFSNPLITSFHPSLGGKSHGKFYYTFDPLFLFVYDKTLTLRNFETQLLFFLWESWNSTLKPAGPTSILSLLPSCCGVPSYTRGLTSGRGRRTNKSTVIHVPTHTAHLTNVRRA